MVTALCLLALAASSMAAADASVSSDPAPRFISVPDMVRQGVIGDPKSITWAAGTLTWNESSAEVSLTSPDRSWVAVVIRRGNPEQGTNDAQLLVYRTAELMGDAAPVIVAAFASATNTQPIGLVQWLADSETLVFAGTRGRELPQVYRVNVQARDVQQLTKESRELLWYDITPDGNRLVTMSKPAAIPPSENPECMRRGCRVTATSLRAADHGFAEKPAPLTVYDFRTGASREVFAPALSDDDIERCKDDLKGGISPNGRFGLRICTLKPHRWPQWWIDYTANPEFTERLPRGHNGGARQWILADFERGVGSRFTPAPFLYLNVLYDAVPIWIEGGHRVIITGVMEPLVGVDAKERARRAAQQSILVIDPASGETERIDFLDRRTARVVGAYWDEKAQTLRVESVDASRAALPLKQYRRDGKRWRAEPASSAGLPLAASKSERSVATDDVQLVVEQSLNDPPVLFAVDRRTGLKRRLLDPNPWLAERTLGRVDAIQWRSRDGREWRGGLYYPPNYTGGTRLPVVLQTHGFRPDQFTLHGITRNFAAQPIAAHGMLVLQIEENDRGTLGPQEWPTVQAGYEAAIDHLDSLGLADRARVGIIGWSRTGPQAAYTLTHSSYPFAAAAFTATADFGWHYYLNSGTPKSMESNFGAAPFGEGLDVWRAYSSPFNLDRVNAPMLMWVGGGAAGLWDWYAGLRRLGKPVEYWVLPDGVHEVFKAEERLLTGQLLVDWFRFWLKGEEDSDPAKEEQYARWRNMREQQAQVAARQAHSSGP